MWDEVGDDVLGAVFACRADLLSKLDKATTAIVLNIAEGNGRFTGTDQARFFGIAYKSTVQSASLVDLATANGPADCYQVDQGRELLRRIAAMLTSLSKVVAHDTSSHTYLVTLKPPASTVFSTGEGRNVPTYSAEDRKYREKSWRSSASPPKADPPLAGNRRVQPALGMAEVR